MLYLMVTIMISALSWSSLARAGEVLLDHTVPQAGVTTVWIKHEEGTVRIEGMETETIHVRAEKVKGGLSCLTKVRTEGDTVLVKTAHALFSGLSCEVDLVVTMPRTLAVRADSGASRVQLAHLRGPLHINMGAGHVRGTIDSEDTHIKLGAGHVDLVWGHVPQRGILAIKAGAGVVTLTFPRGTTIRPDLVQGFGRIINALQTSSTSGFLLQAKVGFGSVTLQYPQSS
ncbi:MAG: hypothetical protein HYV02_08070 [Deltaproteobacteria bacterium]|nr:hypothetical protein [Deltaproteobacteria bacterium]